jgi:hypothetical protein
MSSRPHLENYARITKEQTEIELAKTLFECGLTTSPAVDRAASWLLAGIGATAALVVANLDKTVAFIGPSRVSVVLWLLLAAALFGLLQKYMAILVQIQVHVALELKKSLVPILEAYAKKEEEFAEMAKPHVLKIDTQIQIEQFLRSIKEIVPWYQKWDFRRKITAGQADPLHLHKHAARLYNRQMLYALVEFISTLAVLVVVATGI